MGRQHSGFRLELHIWLSWMSMSEGWVWGFLLAGMEAGPDGM